MSGNDDFGSALVPGALPPHLIEFDSGLDSNWPAAAFDGRLCQGNDSSLLYPVANVVDRVSRCRVVSDRNRGGFSVQRERCSVPATS